MTAGMIVEIDWGTKNYPHKVLYEQVTDDEWQAKNAIWKKDTNLPMPMPFGHIMFTNPENYSNYRIVKGQQKLF